MDSHGHPGGKAPRGHWWRSRGGDLAIRLIGVAVAAMGGLILYLVGLFLSRSPPALLGLLLAFGGCFIVAAGSALALIGNKFLSAADGIREKRRPGR